MKKYIIVTDSCADLDKDLRGKYDIEYIPMRVTYDDNDIPADLDWGTISAPDFYNMMRNGVRFRTAQVNAEEYRERFTKYINDGFDILSISCSSALSSSVNASKVVMEELKVNYPDTKIYCIDSLNSCLGLGILCITASALRSEGKSIDEVANYIEENKLKMHQFATVESLNYLKRAGRVSTTSAVFGGLLQIKPIIISDANGQNVAVEKVKGRKASLDRIAEMLKENIEDNKYQKIGIAHADCPDVAQAVETAIKERLNLDGIEIIRGYIGPIVGASVGPGTIGVYCFGKEVTFRG